MYFSHTRPPLLRRRQMLRLLAGGAGLSMTGFPSLFLAGCGGDDSYNDTFGPGGTIRPDAVFDRAQPTGTARQQLDMHAKAVEDLALLLATPLAELQPFADRLKQFIEIAPADTVPGGGRGRQQPVPLNYRQLRIITGDTIAVLSSQIQRHMNALVQLDTVGYLGDQVTRQLGLSGGTSVANPQWNLAFGEKLFYRITVMSSLLHALQTVGVKERAQQIIETPDSAEKVVDYVHFASGFNTWISDIYTRMRVTPPAAGFLQLEIPYTEINAQLARVRALVKEAPFGMPLVEGTNRGRDIDWGGQAQGAFQNGMGDIVGGTFDPGSLNWEQAAAAPATRAEASVTAQLAARRIGQASVSVEGGGGGLVQTLLGLTQAFVDDRLQDTGVPWIRVASTITTCFVNLTLGTMTVIASIQGTVVSAGVATGATLSGVATGWGTALGLTATAAFAGLTAWGIESVRQTYSTCADDIQMRFDEMFGVLEPNPPAGSREVAAVNPSGFECDQLAGAGVGQGTAGGASGGGRAVQNGQRVADFNVEAISVGQARALLAGPAGGASTTPFPRTFPNIRNAAVALLLDMARRSASLTQPSVSGNTISYTRSNFAALLSRDQGTQRMRIPAIPDALLLCTGVGMLPMRNTEPKDINQMDALPQLPPAPAAVGTGVTADVQ